MPEPPDDEARWAEAREALAHGPREAMRRRLRRQRIVAASLAAVIVIVGLLPLLWIERAEEPARTSIPDWRRWAGLVLLIAALAVIGLGMFWLLRAFRGRWTSPLSALTRRQNRELVAMVWGTRPAEPAKVGLARHVAEVMLLRRPLVALLSGGGLVWVALILLDPSWWRLVLLVLLIALYARALLILRRNEQRARRFLAEHPAPDA
jgi:protein-S-isoprenylcysteine O-methyltransferase Ste14